MFKALLIPTLNDDDNDTAGKPADICGPKEEPNTEDDEDTAALVCGGDWLIPDHEMPEVCLCGSVIIPALEKPFDIG